MKHDWELGNAPGANGEGWKLGNSHPPWSDAKYRCRWSPQGMMQRLGFAKFFRTRAPVGYLFTQLLQLQPCAKNLLSGRCLQSRSRLGERSFKKKRNFSREMEVHENRKLLVERRSVLGCCVLRLPVQMFPDRPQKTSINGPPRGRQCVSRTETIRSWCAAVEYLCTYTFCHEVLCSFRAKCRHWICFV